MLFQVPIYKSVQPLTFSSLPVDPNNVNQQVPSIFHILPNELIEKIFANIDVKDWKALYCVERKMYYFEHNSLYWKIFAQKVGIISHKPLEIQEAKLKKYGINVNDLEKCKNISVREKVSSLLPQTPYNLFCYERHNIKSLNHSNTSFLLKLDSVADKYLKQIEAMDSPRSETPKHIVAEREAIFKKYLSTYSKNSTIVKTNFLESPSGLFPRYKPCFQSYQSFFESICRKMKNVINIPELKLMNLFSSSQSSFSACDTSGERKELYQMITSLKAEKQEKLAAQAELYLAKMYCYDLSSKEVIDTVYQLLGSILSCGKASKSVIDEAEFLLVMLCFEPGGQPDNFSDVDLTKKLIHLNTHGKLSPVYQIWVKIYLCSLVYEGRTPPELFDNQKALELLKEAYKNRLERHLYYTLDRYISLFEVRCGSEHLKNDCLTIFAEESKELESIYLFAMSVQVVRGLIAYQNYRKAKENLVKLVEGQVLKSEDHAIALAAIERATELLCFCDEDGNIIDKNHMVDLIKKNKNWIKHASLSLLNSAEFYMDAIKINFELQQNIPRQLFKNDTLAKCLIENFIPFINTCVENRTFRKLQGISDRAFDILKNVSAKLSSNIDFGNSALEVFEHLLEVLKKHPEIKIASGPIVSMHTQTKRRYEAL